MEREGEDVAELICVMCNENKAGGDGLCVKCRFKLNTQHIESMTDRELMLPDGRYHGKTKNSIPNGSGEITYNEHDFPVPKLSSVAFLSNWAG